MVFAQASTANYTFSTATNGSLALDANGTAIDMSTGTTQLVGGSADQTVSSVASIGFSYTLMGNTYTQFYAGANGLLGLGGTTFSSSLYSPSTGTTTTPLIAPFAGDLQTGSSGKIHYKVVGSAPNRTLVVEYLNMNLYYSSGVYGNDATFQVRLYETSGIVEFVYGTVAVSNILTASSVAPAIGFATNSTANNFAYVTISSNTATTSGSFTANPASTVGAITNLTSASDGSRRVYKLTPAASVAPATALNFTSVTASSMVLNWTASSPTTGVTGYQIYKSTDGISYSLVGTVNGSATVTYSGSGTTSLTPSTTYFWRVVAISEAVSSTNLDANQATSAATFSGTKTIGAVGADYTTITAAISAATSGALAGPVILSLQSDYSSAGETFPITIGNISGNSATNTITIRPASSGLSITSSNTTATIDLNGANYVIIDGRVNGAGSKDLIVSNTSAATGGTAIRFINEASNNTVRYCTLRSVFSSATSGVLVFSTTTGSNGNDNNTIDNNDIDCGAGATASPSANTVAYHGIYASGTTTTTATNNSSNTISNNNIFNFFIPTSATTSGITVSSGNTDWTINANSFYQTSTRTATASTAQINVINISNSSSGNNFTITNNFIGGSQASAGGSAWTVTGAFTSRFRGISLSIGTTTASSVQGNTIANINFTSSSGTSTIPGIFAGIYLTAGNANIGNTSGNTLGSGTGNGSISITGSTTGAISYGICTDATSTVSNISNNIIGSITTIGSTTSIAIGFTGIATSAGTTLTISGNSIGSSATTNSINASTAATVTANPIITGINNSSSATISITNNTIANMNNASVPSSASSSNVIRGIVNSSGTATITGNTVRNLSTAANATSTTSSASVMGISNTSTTAGLTLSQNIVHTLANTNASAAVVVIGIHNNGPTTGTNVIARNFIHSLKISTSVVGFIYGINVSGGTATYQNNMVRIGLDETGASMTAAYDIRGINDASGTNNFYHNSVYIGGTGVTSGTTNTFAFISGVTSNTRGFQNNIFVNSRSNSTGTGLNVAFSPSGTIPSPTGLTSNNNLYFANGTGGTLIRNNSIAYTLTAWRAASNLDNASHLGDPNFVASTGTSSTVDLHIQGTTPAEGNGTNIAAVTDDYDGTTRSGVTPVDIGADAGSFTTSDGSPPVITYTTLTSGTNTNRALTNFATITDNIGVSGSSKPRFYYKKSTDNDAFVGNTSGDNGWKYVVASNSSSPYSFTIDYSLINGGSVANNDVIQYFVVAQDTSNNLVSIPDGATASGNPPADNINGKSTTVNTYTILTTTLSGTISVGSGQTYTTLTGAGGLFAAMNTSVVTGNLTVNITSDITEDGTNSLSAIAEEPYGSNFTTTIQPSTTSMRTISATAVASGTPMININGADFVSFDGRSGGSGSFLTFRNTNSTAANTGASIQFTNGALSGTIRNAVIENNGTSSTRGAIIIGASGTNTVTITTNDIRDATAGTTGQPVNGIYSNLNTNTVTVSSNNIFNCSGTGVLFTTVANACSITGNSFYATTTSTSTAQTSISVQSGNNHSITGNFIGGNTSSAGGTAWINSAIVTFKGITTAGSTTTANSIQNNTIQNISLTNAGAATFTGIEVTTGLSNIGTSTGNTIGHTSTSGSITVAGSSTTTGINSTTTSTITVSNNLIANITASGTGTGVSIRGIFQNANALFTATLNIIKNLSTASTSTNASTTTAAVGIYTTSTNTSQTISRNQIFAISGTTVSAVASQVMAIYTSGSSSVGTINRNTIYGMTNTSTSASSLLLGIYLFNGSWTITNNFVSLVNGANTNDPIIRGIYENTSVSTTNTLYYNTVRIGGTASASTASACVYRAIGCTWNLKNNILINERSGGTGKHYAIVNAASTPATGWSASSSNYNVLYSTTAATVGLWTSDQTLAQFQVTSSGDANSNSNDITFTDEANGDLHISGGSIGSVNLRGTLIGSITEDFDGDVRPSVSGTPYIGADENLASPLPIELLKFTGSAKPDFNVLTWTTASEINSSHFEVERLNADKVFENIAIVTAAGNSREINQYQFHDATFTKTNAIEYYRLKMVDRDDNFKYSDVIAVKRNEDAKASVSLYPNPSSELVNIIISNADVTKIQVRVLDVVGKIIYENNNLMSNEINSIPVADFPSGIYTLQVIGLSENINQKFIKK
jgi:hypothetical protein